MCAETKNEADNTQKENAQSLEERITELEREIEALATAFTRPHEPDKDRSSEEEDVAWEYIQSGELYRTVITDYTNDGTPICRINNIITFVTGETDDLDIDDPIDVLITDVQRKSARGKIYERVEIEDRR